MRYLLMVTAFLFSSAAQAQAPIHPTPMTAADIAAISDVIPGRPRLVYDIDTDPPTLMQCVNDGAAIECTAVSAPSIERTSIAALVGGFVWLPACDAAQGLFAADGQTITDGATLYPDLAAKWPTWVSGANVVMPNWAGRFLRNAGGNAGAVGATQSDATAQNGLNFAFYGNGSGNGGTHDTGSQGLWGGTAMSHSGPNRTNAVRRFAQDVETRPHNVALVLCVIAAPLAATPGHVLITGSVGPGAGGVVNVPTLSDGKTLIDVSVKLSNGAGFSPPLDTDDGTNRWWYDFDHTTGEITFSRFGAFIGGAYRIVALYE